MEIPVYLATGLLESGKTCFLKETLDSEDFTSNERSLLITCEEGVEEYDEEFLNKVHATLAVINDQEELTLEKLNELAKKHDPDRVLIEYNGMWQLQDFLNMNLPKYWTVVQIINIVNADTFDVYFNNMRSLIMEQFTNADMIIFNRCEDDTPGAAYLRNIKAVNRRASVYFETKSGKPLEVEEELPYNLDAPIVEIEDDDFGIFYIDAMDNTKQYEGKTFKFKGLVYKGKKFASNVFVPGRFAMTCCVEDIQFIGFICKGTKELQPMISSLKERDWVTVTVKMKNEFCMDYRRKGPVLYPISIERAEKPKEELVYF